MSTASQDSSLDVRPLGSRPKSSAHSPSLHSADRKRKPGEIWINGDVLACACPQCHAPMSIRLWLMVADCWQCGASVELTEKQERQALELLRKQAAANTAPTQTPAVTRPKIEPAPARPAFKEPPPQKPKRLQPEHKPATQPSPARPVTAPPIGRQPIAKPPVARKPIQLAIEKPSEPFSWKDLLGDMPAWFISALLHVILMMLLGLWTIEPEQEEPELILAVAFSTQNSAGAPPAKVAQEEIVEVPDPGEEETELPKQDEATLQAMKEAGELSLTPDDPAGNLPPLDLVVEAVSSPQTQRMFQGRDPRIRAQVVEREGGSIFTEQAVAQGLRWIARHQNPDGSWSLSQFPHGGDCNGRCSGAGIAESDTGATALALLPMLGAGQTQQQGIYKQTVGHGLQWLIDHQGADGDLRGEGHGRMYAHGQATIVLCEAYALTGDEELRQAAQKAINFIVAAQHPAGGWRYSPREPGDTSVVGWQLMALRSGKMAGLEVPARAFSRANRFLDSVSGGDHGGLYEYMEGQGMTPTMTAEGLLCRQYLGWKSDHLGLREGVNWLVEGHLPSRQDVNIYYWYYATQVMHHVGGEAWQRWNFAMRDTLLAMRETKGHEAGSWAPAGGIHGGYDVVVGGRLYMTSLAICTLEVYYRHLPLYRGVAVEP